MIAWSWAWAWWRCHGRAWQIMMLATCCSARVSATCCSVGQGQRHGPLGATLGQHPHDLGDHVARAINDDAVAHAHIHALDLVKIVQGGVADGDAANRDRLQAGHRGQCAGARSTVMASWAGNL